MAFKRVIPEQYESNEEQVQEEPTQSKTRFKRVERLQPSLSTFTREGYQVPYDQDPYYDISKQVGYQGLRGASGSLGDIINLITEGASKGLGYLGVPQDVLDLTNQVYSYIAPKTSADIDAKAIQAGINPEAQTIPGRIAGNIADTVGSAAALGASPRSITALGIGEGLGEAAIESGIPETVGTAIKVGSSLVGKKSPKLIGTKKQQPIINFLRKNGFTDNQITPLLQDERKVSIISKFALKGGKAQRISSELKQAIGGIYDTIRAEGDKIGILTQPEKTGVVNNLYEIRDKIPLKWQKLINPIITRFENSKGSASDLVNLYQDVNAEVAGQKGGKAILGLFKDSATNGLSIIKSELASDFKLINDLYGLNARFGKTVNPGKWDFLSIGQGIEFIRGLVNLDFASLAKDLGVLGARKLSTELLTNPRLQNITKRIISNINANQSNLVISGVKNLIKEIRKTDPETANKIEEKTQSTSTFASE